MNELHKPVMTKEFLHYLKPKTNGIYIDSTLGSGGHSRTLLENCPQAKIIAFDHDQEAINRCQQNLFFSPHSPIFIHDNFVNFSQHLSNLGVSRVDGFLFDLGVSSEQLSDDKRGFSYRQEGPLDMRMDIRNKINAADIINNCDYQELADIFFEYGEERKARKIAQRIDKNRAKGKITTTQQLVKIIASCQNRKPKKHPAKRVFQALRIAVNQELINLSRALETTFQYLNIGGKVIVISYHSLEDRIVKRMFKKYSKLGFHILTKKPLTPSAEELAENRRARSAKMRVIARL